MSESLLLNSEAWLFFLKRLLFIVACWLFKEKVVSLHLLWGIPVRKQLFISSRGPWRVLGGWLGHGWGFTSSGKSWKLRSLETAPLEMLIPSNSKLSPPSTLQLPPPRQPHVCSVSLFWFHRQLYLRHILVPHISDIICYLYFPVWIILLTATISRSIRVAADNSLLFFFKAE